MQVGQRLNQALKFAVGAHEGVADKGGQPYILHPIRVMLQMDTEDEQVVALLHDVVEDTPITLGDIEHHFGTVVMEGVDAMTRRSGETYFDYIHRAKLHPIGRKVKIADTLDNLSPARLSQLPEKEQGVAVRYEKALRILRGLA